MHPSRKLLTLPACLLLGLSLGGAPAGAEPSGPDPRVPTHDRLAQQASDVLAEVQALLGGDQDGRSLTIALRDLAMLKDLLPPAKRERAEQILARPGDSDDPYIDVRLPLASCSATICVHYRESGQHAPAGSDGDPATVPDYINRVRNTLQNVNDAYVDAGYRRPKPDGDIGGETDKVDVYIGNIGVQGLYGYCTSDDPHDPQDPSDPQYGDYSFWAYCTLDNDYSSNEFPTNTPLENMRVTAAHEYYHAVQYAYDAWEDGWILESTATWAEDELFDNVNDNRQYLRDSPLTKPARSMDKFGGLFHYGTWIWWRYLTEKYDAETGALPNLVLDVWEKLDGSPGGPDLYSTQGLARVLGERGTTLKRQFQLFSAANRHPGGVYDEGGARAYSPVAPYKSVPVSPSAPNPALVAVRRDHLSSATVRFTPRQTDQRDWRLRLALDLPPTRRGSAAVVLVYKKGGGVTTTPLRLSTTGAARKTVPFNTGAVRKVEVVLVNASSRFDCWHGTAISCQGTALDDGLRLTVDGRAFRA